LETKQGTVTENQKLDRKEALVRFYQGLAELKMLGFVKPSKRKTDHVARVKWL
jgi:origin recognition complex subunit 3